MKIRPTIKIITSIFLIFFITSSYAEELLMVRTKQNFPEAMLKLQDTIRNHNYTISRIQRIDIGLTKSGYATDKYRIVFFADKNEIATISNNYPHLIPYIPWKIAIFAEQEDTLLVTIDPMQFSDKNHPGADKYLLKWKKDIKEILSELRESN